MLCFVLSFSFCFLTKHGWKQYGAFASPVGCNSYQWSVWYSVGIDVIISVLCPMMGMDGVYTDGLSGMIQSG